MSTIHTRLNTNEGWKLVGQQWRPNVKKVKTEEVIMRAGRAHAKVGTVLMLITTIIHPSTLLYLSNDKVDNIPLFLNPESRIFSLSFMAF